MTNDDQPTHKEAEDLHETHATDFQLTGNQKELILSFGEAQINIQPDGQSEVSEILYDTKVRMDHQSAGELLMLLQQNIDIEEVDTDRAQSGRGVH